MDVDGLLYPDTVGKDLSIRRLGYLWGILEPRPRGYQRATVLIMTAQFGRVLWAERTTGGGGVNSGEEDTLGEPLSVPNPPQTPTCVSALGWGWRLLGSFLSKVGRENKAQPTSFSPRRFLLKGHKELKRLGSWHFFPAWPGNST